MRSRLRTVFSYTFIHCCAHIFVVFLNHWSHVWNCRPFELIAVASEKAVSIWKLQFPLNSRGRLVVIRAAHLPHHNGEVSLLVALWWFSLFCCENEIDLFTMFTINYFNWFQRFWTRPLELTYTAILLVMAGATPWLGHNRNDSSNIRERWKRAVVAG